MAGRWADSYRFSSSARLKILLMRSIVDFFFVIHQMGVAAAHFKGTVPEQFRNHGLTCA